jgi:hypothetical protein
LFLHHLRSVIFDFDLYPEKRLQRVPIVEKILDASPNLSYLAVPSQIIHRCKKTYSNLKHLHLFVERFYPEPKQYVDIRRLSRLAPHLCRFETSDANILINEDLAEFVLEIIRHFHQLVYLILNKDSLYSSKQEKKIAFEKRFIAAGNGQLFDANNIQIKFAGNDRLHIWL